MACSYNFQPTLSTVAPSFTGYNSPMNVETILRNKAGIFSSALPTERSLINAAIPTPFAAAAGINNTIAPIAYNANSVETGRVYGAECGAQLAQIIAARLNSFVGQEVAVRIAAQWGAEVCANLVAELAMHPISSAFEAEQCSRRCAVYGAEQGAKLGSLIAQRFACGPFQVEEAARIGAELFAEVCAKLFRDVASRFGGASSWNFGGRVNNWTGSFPSTFGSFGANNWANLRNNTWFNAPSDKLYNIAFRPSSEVEMYTLTNPIRMIDVEGNRQLYLAFELKSFKPEEVIVTLNKAERAIVVEAAHESKDGKEHTVARKYSRKFVLPETLSKVDLTKVELKSYINHEGFLVVECQLPKMTTEEIAKCPTMSELYTKMPAFGGFNAAIQAFGGVNGVNCHVNAVKPVTVKTA